MSDSREQSYYEIALTNRQVMTIFVVLLVCVLAAFLGGVWVGRGSETAVTTAEPAAIEAGVEAGEPPLEEMDFFDRGDDAAGQGQAATVPPEPEVSGSRRQAGGRQAEPQQPVIIEEIGRPQRRDPQQQAASASGGESSTASPVTGEALFVQLISTADQAKAEKVLGQVRGGGYPSVMMGGDVNGQLMYRVRVGPYATRDEAQSVADRIRRTYKLDVWITP